MLTMDSIIIDIAKGAVATDCWKTVPCDVCPLEGGRRIGIGEAVVVRQSEE